MYKKVEEYLNSLKDQLTGCDPAIVQDALSDAEEYLRNALQQAGNVDEGEALSAIVDKFGSPEEVASGYRARERCSPQTPVPPVSFEPKRSSISRFFGVFADPKSWTALAYMLLALGTGIFYFVWVITGFSVSAGLIVLVIGLPFLALFLLSIRLISFVEGIVVEAMLGTRMPHRPRFFGKSKGTWQKIKNLFAERTTWTGILYGVMQLPLGIVYFTLCVTLLSVSFYLTAWPFSEFIFHTPAYFIIGDTRYQAANPLVPFLTVPLGILLFTVTLHISKAVGRLHGAWAKLMLVSKANE